MIRSFPCLALNGWKPGEVSTCSKQNHTLFLLPVPHKTEIGIANKAISQPAQLQAAPGGIGDLGFPGSRKFLLPPLMGSPKSGASTGNAAAERS